MCLAVYMGSDVELLSSKWDKDNPSFFVEALSEKDKKKVEKQFSKRYLYYAGSHEGCGCGFYYDDNDIDDEDDKADNLKSKESVNKFVTFLQNSLKRTQDIELFACWEGDQNTEPGKKENCCPSDFIGASFKIDAWDSPELYKVSN